MRRPPRRSRRQASAAVRSASTRTTRRAPATGCCSGSRRSAGHASGSPRRRLRVRSGRCRPRSPELVDFAPPESVAAIRDAVRELCAGFPGEYWRGLEPDRYPEEFVAALTAGGWLGALVPERYGGAGLSLTEASVILEEVARSGANPGAVHAQMYIMGT